MDDLLANDPDARPGGVTAIAVLAAFSGLISISVSIIGLIGPRQPSTHPNPALAAVALIVQGLLGVGYVVVATGLWHLRRWAFWVAIVASVLLLVDYGFEFWKHIVASPVTVGGLVLPIF